MNEQPKMECANCANPPHEGPCRRKQPDPQSEPLAPLSDERVRDLAHSPNDTLARHDDVTALAREVERLRALGLVLPKYEHAGGLVWAGAATCIHCGKQIYDNGTVYVHRNFDMANGAVFIIETQWCNEADKRFIAETEYTTDVIWTATDAQMAKVRQAADRAKLRFLQNRVAPLQAERDWLRAEKHGAQADAEREKNTSDGLRQRIAELEAESALIFQDGDCAREYVREVLRVSMGRYAALREIALALGLRADAEPDAVLAAVKEAAKGRAAIDTLSTKEPV